MFNLFFIITFTYLYVNFVDSTTPKSQIPVLFHVYFHLLYIQYKNILVGDFMKRNTSFHTLITYIKNPLFIGTCILTAAGFASKILGFFYRIFLSHIFSEEALGILSLASPIVFLVHSICVSGIQSAITRFVASTYHHQKNQAYRYLFSGMTISITLSSILSFLIYQNADFIAHTFIRETRCSILLKIVSLSFPLAATHACINGFFFGCKKTVMPALSQFFEQCIRILCVFAIFYYVTSHKIQPSLAITGIGILAGECFSAIFSSLWLVLHTSTESHFPNPTKFPISYQHSSQIIKMALPISLNRLVVSLLSTIETTQIPSRLLVFGYTHSQALSIYGIFSGMAFPLILFPSALTSSVSTLLLPTVSEAQAKKDSKKLKKLLFGATSLSLSFGICCMCFFFLASDFLGAFLFHHETVGHQIQALSLLCPFFYSTGILNSMLHGLGKTATAFLINLLSLGSRLCIVFLCIPFLGFYGYLYGLTLCQFIQNLLLLLALRHYIHYN